MLVQDGLEILHLFLHKSDHSVLVDSNCCILKDFEFCQRPGMNKSAKVHGEFRHLIKKSSYLKKERREKGSKAKKNQRSKLVKDTPSFKSRDGRLKAALLRVESFPTPQPIS